MQRWVITFGVVLVSLALIGAGVYRWYYGDRVRSFYCRIAVCPDLDAFDDLCALFSEAELGSFESKDERLAWIRDEATKLEAAIALERLDEAMRLPLESRYTWFRDEVRDEGAPDWTCPAIERALTSTAAK